MSRVTKQNTETLKKKCMPQFDAEPTPELSDASDEAQDYDKEWFQAHTGRNYFLRNAIPNEHPGGVNTKTNTILSMEQTHEQGPPHTLVMQYAPGFRSRLPYVFFHGQSGYSLKTNYGIGTYRRFMDGDDYDPEDVSEEELLALAEVTDAPGGGPWNEGGGGKMSIEDARKYMSDIYQTSLDKVRRENSGDS